MEAIQFTSPLELERHQRSELADTVGSPGFRWVQKILENEVQKFFTVLMNLESGTEKVVEGQRVARTAAQLVQGAVDRINLEVHIMGEELRASGQPQTPVDFTEGLIDFGPVASTQQSFEEETDIEY